MDHDAQHFRQPAPPSRLATVSALAIAALGWFALGSEFEHSVRASLGAGHGIAQALYLYFRFFTILTNLFVACLMSVTAWRGCRRAASPPAGPYAAALVYSTVTAVTYEALLRRLWSPQGLQFYTDMILHDIVPLLVLSFWVAWAPKRALRWRDPLHWLEFPAVYFAATLAAGASGGDYPYNFLDAGHLGYAPVFLNAAVFLACFYALGLCLTAAARLSTRREAAPAAGSAQTKLLPEV